MIGTGAGNGPMDIFHIWFIVATSAPFITRPRIGTLGSNMGVGGGVGRGCGSGGGGSRGCGGVGVGGS